MKSLLQNIFPSFDSIRATGAIKKLIKKIESEKYVFINEDKLSNISNKIVESLELNLKRKDNVEDKSKSTLMVIAVILAFITGSISSIEIISSKDFIGIICLIILLIGIIYLTLGAIHSLQVLNIKGYNIDYINDYIKQDGNKIEILEDTGEQKSSNNYSKEDIKRLFYYNKLNELVIILKLNNAYSSFISIRNGIILVVMFFILFIGKNILSSNSINNKTNNSNNTQIYNSIPKDTISINNKKISTDTSKLKIDSSTKSK